MPYAKPCIFDEDIQQVTHVLKSEQITRGEVVKEFEDTLAKTLGAKYCVVFNSGSSALMAAYFALDVDRFCTLLTTPITYVATCSFALIRGAKLCLIDVLSNGCMDIKHARQLCQKQSGRVIFVPMHYGGEVVSLTAFLDGLQYPNVSILEDAAHALYAKDSDQNYIGSCMYSDLCVFSFHPAKVMTTGEGGCVTTNNPDILEKLRLFRNNGIQKKGFEYDCLCLSGNFHMTELQAALGLAQIKRLPIFLEKRKKIYALYKELLADIPHLKFCEINTQETSGFHLCVVLIDFLELGISRMDFQQMLLEKGIQTDVHYKPLHHLSAIQPHLFKSELEVENAEHFYAQALTLPLHPDVQKKDVEWICTTVRDLILKPQVRTQM